MRKFCAILGLLCVSLAQASVPATPRPTPEFVITIPGGKQILLSSMKGKVTVVEFIFTNCVHCQHLTQMTSKVYKELERVQVVGIAINPMAQMYVADFTREFKVPYQIGYSEPGPALDYLGINPVERWVVPQVVIIDKKGMIRYQTPALGDEKVQNEKFMRDTLEALLKEPTATTPAKKPATTAKK